MDRGGKEMRGEGGYSTGDTNSTVFSAPLCIKSADISALLSASSEPLATPLTASSEPLTAPLSASSEPLTALFPIRSLVEF